MPHHSYAHIHGIDGLRAIAVLAVIIFHSDYLNVLPGGFVGVDMFFVISGYVISQSLSERPSSGLLTYLADFYRRRCLRILPALLCVLLVSFVLSAMFMPQFWLSDHINRTGLAAFFGLSNAVLALHTDTYFSPGSNLNPFLHTWSLGVEEQFYLLFPGLFWLWLRYRTQSWLARALLPVLAAVSLLVCALQTSNAPLSAFYLLPGRFWELAAGAMLYQAIGAKRGVLTSVPLGTITLLAGAALLIGSFGLARPSQFPFPWAVVTVSGTLLLLTAIILPAPHCAMPLQRVLQGRALTYIGRLSYSLYLWHWPVRVFFQWTTGLELLWVQCLYPVLVFALAAASYHWLERPVRASPLRQLRAPGLTLAVSGAAVGLLALTCVAMTRQTEHLSLSQTRDTYTWYAYRHWPAEPLPALDEPRLQGRRLFVLGDSHAAAYRTLFTLIALQMGIKVIEYERGGCGVVTLIAADPPGCAARREADFKDLEARARPGDIVFLPSLRMPELQGLEWSKGETPVVDDLLAGIEHEQAAAYASALATLNRLQATGLQVLIEAPKPLFKAPPSRCSDWFNHMNPVCAPGLTVFRSTLQRLRAPQLALIERLQQQHPALAVWDPFPVLCPTALCSAYDRKNGKPLFFDSNHLSGHGNRILAPSFSAALQTLWGIKPLK
ncbi:acyltransferase family protein [Pseudomonas sp. WS 5071]|uniref:acyltransferase family protein n=1 Tax=Pseudomonas sp. WS 5071 TaxID=2717479 RepID=UPI0014767A41|nr:acyltransferase family protein [Pseudomonas sp. WS 5071]NMY74627.1 acyltransferase [Pseudomonas sp. WS 5071]